MFSTTSRSFLLENVVTELRAAVSIMRASDKTTPGSRVLAAAAKAAPGPEHSLAMQQQQQRSAAAARASRHRLSGEAFGTIKQRHAQFCDASLIHDLAPARPRRRQRFTHQELPRTSLVQASDAQRLDAAYQRALATVTRRKSIERRASLLQASGQREPLLRRLSLILSETELAQLTPSGEPEPEPRGGRSASVSPAAPALGQRPTQLTRPGSVPRVHLQRVPQVCVLPPLEFH